MKSKWARYFKLWSETEEFKRKVADSLNVLRSIKENTMVMFSGGKDSTVGVHLTLRVKPDAVVFHYDYQYEVPRAIEKEIIRNAKMLGVKNLVVEKEAIRQKDDRGFFSSATKTVRKYGIGCIVSCLRKEESKRRVLLTEKDTFLGVRNVHVIKDWTWRDVWAYIVSNKLPYLSLYDKCEGKVSYDKSRVSVFFDYSDMLVDNSEVDKSVMWEHFNVLKRKW